MSFGFVGICVDHFVGNFVLSLVVKGFNFENQLIFREVIDMGRVSCFLTHSVVTIAMLEVKYVVTVSRHKLLYA